jgi:uncharacterized membrane protein
MQLLGVVTMIALLQLLASVISTAEQINPKPLFKECGFNNK